MKIGYKKIVEELSSETLIYFIDLLGRKQGTLRAYSNAGSQIRENMLLYTQEYLDGEVQGNTVYYRLYKEPVLK
ncbi:MAG: hypothetical protein MUF42_07690 [Cytophagaceae bacterium]|jgi:hypothetical protein|nr:hypothetical protein [Cytophagaceae bacterium]